MKLVPARVWVVPIVVLALYLAAPGHVFAQAGNGTLTGTVVDAQGAADAHGCVQAACGALTSRIHVTPNLSLSMPKPADQADAASGSMIVAAAARRLQ